jgi:epoxyqueuosine reductase
VTCPWSWVDAAGSRLSNRFPDDVTSAPTQPVDRHVLASQFKERARSLGFDLVGIASPEPSHYRQYFRDWLDTGQAGTMDYLGKRFDERVDPATYFPGVRSVLCVALNYHVRLEEPATDVAQGRVARYALGVDYHEVIKDRLHDLADYIRAEVPGSNTRCGVDTVPVMEKELAARAGLGWVGKNTCLINPSIGSWLLLGEVLTTIDLPFDTPGVDRCGTCRRCIDACPTGAITAPHQLDARRCISYLTIEHRGDLLPDQERMIGGWVYGCDVCQDVCPFNTRSPTAADPLLQPRFSTGTLDLNQLLEWREPTYPPPFRHSAMKRVKLPVLQRNAEIVKRNAAISRQ